MFKVAGMKIAGTWRFAGIVTAVICAAGAAWCQRNSAVAERTPELAAVALQAAQEAPDFVIENDSDLPDTYPGARYVVRLQAHGGTAPLRWRVIFGTLPPGLRLENDTLRGEPDRAGEFHFTVSVADSGAPAVTTHKAFVIRVISAFKLNWKAQAHVDGNRIEGSAEVTNTTADDMDLTFYVLAVAGDGRATAIGYQHFLLPRATVAKTLPFGETLPRGGYVVHVDAVGEVGAKKLIYREHMQTPEALQVTVGP
jgi:hypothetical protein